MQKNSLGSWFWFLFTVVLLMAGFWFVYDFVNDKYQNIFIEIIGTLLTAFVTYLLFIFKLIPNQSDSENIKPYLSKIATKDELFVEISKIKHEEKFLDLQNRINILENRIEINNRQIIASLEEINKEIQVLHPNTIPEKLAEERQKTDFWLFNGGTGTYTKTDTLPKLAEISKGRKIITIQLQIINPLNYKLCQQYSTVRRNLRKDDPDIEKWKNPNYVSNHSFATIVTALILKSEYQNMIISIGLKDHFSLFRFDITSSKVFVTKEDQSELAILFNKNSSSYNSYRRDFENTLQQCKILPPPNVEINYKINALDELKIQKILNSVGLYDDQNKIDYAGILEILNKNENPYV